MRIDNLQTFVKLRRELVQEREQVSRRLAQINEALGEMPLPSLSATQGASPRESAPQPPAQRAGAGRKATAGGTSLRELVIQVLKEGPKTKEEVLEGVQQRGYRFQTNNPLNSLGVILYGKSPKLNRVEGRFSLPGGATTGGARAGTSKAGTGGRGQMSAAARARIAEAQRQRWAAARKPSGNKGGAQASQSNGAGQSAKRKISPAGRRAIAEAARRRWAAAKAAGKSRL